MTESRTIKTNQACNFKYRLIFLQVCATCPTSQSSVRTALEVSAVARNRRLSFLQPHEPAQDCSGNHHETISYAEIWMRGRYRAVRSGGTRRSLCTGTLAMSPPKVRLSQERARRLSAPRSRSFPQRRGASRPSRYARTDRWPPLGRIVVSFGCGALAWAAILLPAWYALSH